MSKYKERLICRRVINRLIGKYHCNLQDLLIGKHCILGRGARKQCLKMMLEKKKKSIDFRDKTEGDME